MARGKKQQPEDAVLETAEEELDEALDETNETPDEEEESDEEPTPSRSRAKRAPRKRKEPGGAVAALFKAASEGPAKGEARAEKEAETETDDEGDAEPEAVQASADESPKADAGDKPAEEAKRPRRPRATPEEKQLSGAMETAMEAMVKHWSAAKDISTTMAGNMEKVTQLVQELPAKYEGKLAEIFKEPPPKPTLVTKIAVGMSAVAVVLSLVALQLAQAVRTHVITTEAVRGGQARMARLEETPAAAAAGLPQARPAATLPAAPALARRESAPVHRPVHRAAPVVRQSARR